MYDIYHIEKDLLKFHSYAMMMMMIMMHIYTLLIVYGYVIIIIIMIRKEVGERRPGKKGCVRFQTERKYELNIFLGILM